LVIYLWFFGDLSLVFQIECLQNKPHSSSACDIFLSRHITDIATK
jgi:hypothetical protein